MFARHPVRLGRYSSQNDSIVMIQLRDSMLDLASQNIASSGATSCLRVQYVNANKAARGANDDACMLQMTWSA